MNSSVSSLNRSDNNLSSYGHRGVVYHMYPAPTLNSQISTTLSTYSDSGQLVDSKKSSITSVGLRDDLPPSYEDLFPSDFDSENEYSCSRKP